ncbi:MAG TPA: hypothetical protein VF162_17575 [Streptosporangiaceae bacterium]
MNRVFKRRGRRATLILIAACAATLAGAGGSAVAATGAFAPAAGACVSKAGTPARAGHIGGIVSAVPSSKPCQAANGGSHVLRSIKAAGDTANGTPPLIWHGGAVMGTKQTGPLVVTPIFWNPAGHPMADAYKSLLTTYLSDVASASGRADNIYSILPEYFGTDGAIRYNIKLGTPINDTSPLPASGCKVNRKDTKGIYADNSGYNACIDDAQVIAETNNVVAAHSLPVNLSHIYVLFLPKHVESCFNPGVTTNSQNACTINYQPSAAYCAYHSMAQNGTVYANMPFPIYLSATGFTCGTDVNFPGVIETPNGNPDADTEISPTSHEINEAITDPDVNTGWYDSSGFENGDECAYIFGTTQGASGQFYNQVINGHHYLTQEEFSNSSFFNSGGGCLQS